MKMWVVICNSIYLHIPINLLGLLVNQSTKKTLVVLNVLIYIIIREIQHESYNVVIKVCLHWRILKTDEQKFLRSQLLATSP